MSWRSHGYVRPRQRKGTWTPTWSATGTAVSLGDGTVTGHYILDGDLLHFTVVLTAGSTTTYGTGAWGFTLPSEFVSIAVGQVVQAVAIDDSTAAERGLTFRVGASSSSVFPGTFTSTPALVGTGVPIAWAVSDTLTISGTIQLAP